ncbi:TetR family transcriptional regulator [Parapedobacter pyrenivorans]|uniref:TetR family transcriptional regulator n=1 Tax=Parapedobacter pyrenivorans TaxID=1305674 RepID=A0A917ME66_9SPHI|nr:TetR/AcrR family transcriptional regulator [Parapedobacter pyrenivorans]GGG97895.1 TetR family transcriptional regulator [Parapedobacter pyrenivorans]
MGISERKHRQLEQVRTAILAQSWQIIEEEGWEALSIRRIADAIEYSTPVVYKHFESKEAIRSAFSQEGYALLANRLLKAKTACDSPTDQLMALSNTYWAFAQEHPKHYQIMYGLGIPTCEMVRETREILEVSNVFHETIEAAIQASKQPDTDVHLKAMTFWSILHGLIAMGMISGPGDPQTAKRILEDATAGFIKALMG